MVIRAYLRGDQDALPLVSNTTLIGNSEECDVYLNVSNYLYIIGVLVSKLKRVDLNTSKHT